jgi:hypothetical protein
MVNHHVKVYLSHTLAARVTDVMNNVDITPADLSKITYGDMGFGNVTSGRSLIYNVKNGSTMEFMPDTRYKKHAPRMKLDRISLVMYWLAFDSNDSIVREFSNNYPDDFVFLPHIERTDKKFGRLEEELKKLGVKDQQWVKGAIAYQRKLRS